MVRALRLAGALLAVLLVTCVASCQKAITHQHPLQGTTYSSKAFDTERDLPPGFRGIDASSVFHSLLGRRASFTKSEYETTPDFSQRLGRFLETPLPSGMSPRDRYAFSIRPTFSYDADRGRLTVKLDDLPYLSSVPIDCLWSTVTVPSGSYIGTNAFGVKRVIRRLTETSVVVVPDMPSWLRDQYVRGADYEEDNGFQIPLKPSAAARLDRNLRVLLIGSLGPPFAAREEIQGDPTVTIPIDRTRIYDRIYLNLSAVWLYDLNSGEVLKQYKASTATPNLVQAESPAVAVASVPESAKARSPIRLSGGVVAGYKVSGPAPVYPAIAKSAHLTGSVILAATISTTGEITDLHVVSGPALLTESAIDAVKQWRYRPYTQDGATVEVKTTITVNFNLNTTN